MQAELPQLARDPWITPAWVLAGKAEDEISHLATGRRPARLTLRPRPLAPNQLAMPTQKRRRRHDKPVSTPSREQSRERRKEGAIGRSKRRARRLPTKHRQLMPQHE